MVPIDATKARTEFCDLVNRVAYGGQRVLLKRRGKAVAAVVGLEDLAHLERGLARTATAETELLRTR